MTPLCVNVRRAMAGWAFFFTTAILFGFSVWSWARGQRRLALGCAGAIAVTGVIGAFAVGDVLEMQKVAAYMCLPLSLMWVALFGVTVFTFARGRHRHGAVLLATFLVYTLGGNSWIAMKLQSVLEDTLPPYRPISDYPTFDAVFVLGGGIIRRPDNGEVQISEYGDRVIICAELYRAGKARVLVASGGDSDDQTEASARLWKMMGVPDEAIRGIPRGRVTSTELAEYKKMIDAEAWKNVALVSSAYHLPRAMRTVKKLGMTMTPIAVNRRWPEPPAYDPMFIIPHPDTWARTHQVLWELGGMAVGR